MRPGVATLTPDNNKRREAAPVRSSDVRDFPYLLLPMEMRSVPYHMYLLVFIVPGTPAFLAARSGLQEWFSEARK